VAAVVVRRIHCIIKEEDASPVMKTLVLAVGRLRAGPYADLTAEYLRRSGRFAPVELREVPTVKGGGPAATAAREGERLLAAIEDTDRVVVCDERGREFDTGGLARWLGEIRDRGGSGRLVFVLGGAEGISPAVRERADQVLALSRLTLPHELARLVLCEQVYRVLSLLAGHPYHRGGAAEERRASE
jgi:23S rRNA (pseudouridine1915-N3)-methyltransferase